MAVAIGPNFNYANYVANGFSLTPQPGSQAWQQQMNAQIQQQLSAIPRPQAPPPPQQYQAPVDNSRGGGLSANYASAPAAPPAEDPRLASILAQLQAQAAQGDSYLNDQAAAGVASQRALMQRNLEKSLTQSLSARGLLPGGGNVAKLRAELAAPMEEQLAAQQEQIRQQLLGQRTNTSNNLAAQLADLQKSKNAGASDQQRLQMEMQLNQQKLAQDQQRFQWEAQQQQQRNAYDQAMMQYQMQRDALNAQLQAQAAQAAQGTGFNASAGTGYRPSGGGGGGGGTGMAGFGSGLPSGFDINPGSTNHIGAQRQAEFNSPGNQQLRAEQQWRSQNPGSGISSAGSPTGISSVAMPQGYNPSAYASAMQSSGYGQAQSAFGQMDALSGPIPY